jgi:hypothetical protein
MQPAQPAYFDADFEFSELEVDGCDFLSSLNVQVSSSTTNSLSSSASPPPGPAWTKFHSDHSSAKFFRPKRYLPQSFSAAIDYLCGLSYPPIILEVGSGAGAALFPLLSSLPASTSAVAIDIAPTAIDLLRSQPKFDASLIGEGLYFWQSKALGVPPHAPLTLTPPLPHLPTTSCSCVRHLRG